MISKSQKKPKISLVLFMKMRALYSTRDCNTMNCIQEHHLNSAVEVFLRLKSDAYVVLDVRFGDVQVKISASNFNKYVHIYDPKNCFTVEDLNQMSLSGSYIDRKKVETIQDLLFMSHRILEGEKSSSTSTASATASDSSSRSTIIPFQQATTYREMESVSSESEKDEACSFSVEGVSKSSPKNKTSKDDALTEIGAVFHLSLKRLHEATKMAIILPTCPEELVPYKIVATVEGVVDDGHVTVRLDSFDLSISLTKSLARRALLYSQRHSNDLMFLTRRYLQRFDKKTRDTFLEFLSNRYEL